MPMVDMPLDELHKYQGRNPRPSDYEAYWDRALAEMRAIDPQLELIPSEFQVPFAECFDLYFTGVRGARIHAKYVRPMISKKPHPCILQFHGYWVDAGDWNDKLVYAALGYSLIAMDVRGQGGLSEDSGHVKGNTLYGHVVRGLEDHPDNLFFRQVFLDCAQIASIAISMPEVDPERVGAFGYSQGGALTLACAALEPRIKRLAPVYPFLSDYQRTWEMDLVIDEITKHFRSFDPQHKREAEIFTKLGYIDIQHLADRIQGDVLLTVGLMDRICPPSTQFAVYNKIKANKSLQVFPDFGHEQLPGVSDNIVQFMLDL